MTDERLCGVCGHEESAHVGDDPNGQVCAECGGNGEYELMLHAFEPSLLLRPEAAPSTDEGEARWVRGEESPDVVVWRAVGREVLPYVEMPKSLEAAIRAPLEERIRELEWTLADAIRDARAENERLREALIWMSGSAEFGPGQPAHDHWVEIRDTLLFPPSSTEGAKEGGE